MVALLASAAGCVLVTVVALLLPANSTRQPGPAAPERTAPLAVLRAWDAARVDAWRRGDQAALRDLYTGDSRSGRADRRLLAAYDARGLRVRGLEVQRASVDVEQVSAGRLVLRVTDRLAGGWVRTAAGRQVHLPRDRWSTRRLVMARRDGRWAVVEVRDRAAPAPTRPPR